MSPYLFPHRCFQILLVELVILVFVGGWLSIIKDSNVVRDL